MIKQANIRTTTSNEGVSHAWDRRPLLAGIRLPVLGFWESTQPASSHSPGPSSSYFSVSELLITAITRVWAHQTNMIDRARHNLLLVLLDRQASTQGLQTTTALTLLSSQIMTRDLMKSLLVWKLTQFLHLVKEYKTASTGETEGTRGTMSLVYKLWAPRCKVWDAQSNRLKPTITPPHPCDINPKSTQAFPSYYCQQNSTQIRS